MEKSTYIGLGIFVLIVAGGLALFFNNDGSEKIKTFSVDAKWFEFNPNEIKVKQGDQVTIIINNIDVPHGIAVPELKLNGNDEITFIAEKKGVFDFYCNNFCGEGHSDMVGKIVVE